MQVYEKWFAKRERERERERMTWMERKEVRDAETGCGWTTGWRKDLNERPASAGFRPEILSCHRFIRCKKRKPGIGSWCWSYSFSHSLSHRSKDKKPRKTFIPEEEDVYSEWLPESDLSGLFNFSLPVPSPALLSFWSCTDFSSDFPGDSFLYTYFWQFFSSSSSSGVSLVSLLHSFWAVASQVSFVHRHSSDYLSHFVAHHHDCLCWSTLHRLHLLHPLRQPEDPTADTKTNLTQALQDVQEGKMHHPL